MKLQIFDNNGKTKDRYIIIIDEEVYIFSYDCNMPNGINMYCGKVSNGYGASKDDFEITHYALPRNVLNCITDRLIKN